MAKIDFSAQFGGKDAAAAVLKHFQLLKKVAKGIEIKEFPFAKLAFILRVDGEVHEFGLDSSWNLDIDSKREYLSLDIVITIEDRCDVTNKIIGSSTKLVDIS